MQSLEPFLVNNDLYFGSSNNIDSQFDLFKNVNVVEHQEDYMILSYASDYM